MIWGLVNIFVVYWFYTSAVQAGKKNAVTWAVVGGIAFFAVQLLWVALVPVFSAKELNLDRADRSGSFFLNVIKELAPPLVALIVAGLVRTKFILNEKIAFETVFSLKRKKAE